MVFLAGFAAPAADWLETVSSAFDADQSLAVIGAKILRDDGVLWNAGVTLTNDRSELIGLGADPSSDAFAHRKSIDAVTGEAFAVRREAWQRIGGLSETDDSLEPALIGFCLKITSSGGEILYEPRFSVILRQ
jgi:GT2 family glycosyltransferase